MGGMSTVTFSIRQTAEKGQTYFEVWRRACDSYGECWESLLAEATTRPEAMELLRYHSAEEEKRVAKTNGGA